MGVAFKCASVSGVTVGPQDKAENDLVLSAVEINCAFLEGQVTCEYDGTPVAGAIVKADPAGEGEALYGVTDANGNYCICVPTGTYNILVFCCAQDCCEPTGCVCGCNGVPS